jgi:type IX secretion system PorP/SprF family membrane protein
MNFKHIFFGLVLTAGAMQSVEAQQIQTLNQYIFNPYSYNPATAGTSSVSNLYLNYRRQWNNMPDAPISGLATYDMPISGGKAGVGVQLSTEKAGLNSNVGGKLSYAYHLGLNADKTMKLSFGLSAGFFAQQFDFTRANAVDNADTRLVANNSESATAFTADAGVNFNAGRLNIGVALPQIFNANNLRTNSYVVGTNVSRGKLVPNTLISARYLIGKKEGITVEPIVMARLASDKLEPQFDVALLSSWKQTLFLGAGYRSANVFANTAGINGTVGVRVAQRATIAYNVESLLNTSDNYASPLGLTHDILFGYRFGDVSKEDVTDKTKEVFKGIDDRLARANARIDSLGKADGDRIAALENKPEPVNNTKELESRVNSLNGRMGQAEGEIRDLKNRPTGSTIIQQPASTGNYSTSVNLGAATKLQTVYFAVNSSELDKKAKNILNQVATELTSRGGSVVYLKGTASQEGDKGRNMILSLERSAAVLSYLQKRGVTQTILTTSEGEEASKAAVRKDRSVEIYTLGN